MKKICEKDLYMTRSYFVHFWALLNNYKADSDVWIFFSISSAKNKFMKKWNTLGLNWWCLYNIARFSEIINFNCFKSCCMWWSLVFITYCLMFVSSPICVQFTTLLNRDRYWAVIVNTNIKQNYLRYNVYFHISVKNFTHWKYLG